MLAKILTQSLPGGIPLWQYIGIGLEAGLDRSQTPVNMLEVQIQPTGAIERAIYENAQRAKGLPVTGPPQVVFKEPTDTHLAWSQQDTRAGLERARMIPHVAGSALSSAPQLSYQLYKPISDLGRAVVVPFRRAGVPRVTGLEGLPTLKELIADAMAGAKIAAEVIPPPMKPEATALGLAVGAAAKLLLEKLGQFWGQKNGPPRGLEAPPNPDDFPATGSVKILGVQDGRAYASPTRMGPVTIAGFLGSTNVWQKPVPGSLRWTKIITVNIRPGLMTRAGIDYEMEYFDANDVLQKFETKNTTGIYPLEHSNSIWELKATCASNCEGAQPLELAYPETPSPWTNPDVWPPTGDPVPQPLTLPPLPLPTPPYIAPNLPTPEGLPITVVPFGTTTVRLPNGQTVQTTRLPGYWPQLLNPGGTRAPQPNKIPSLTPVTPFGPVPLPNFPGADPARPTQQVDTAAQVVPLTPTRPATTAVGETTPWPGAAPIPAIGPAPRPTMEGIAEEVGKIERKLEIMMNPAAPGNLLDKFDDFQDLIKPLIEAFFSAQEGTTYGLDSPCEVDAKGDKLPPVEVEVQGALTQHGVLLNRLDALAELLQVHKNLKQPNCKTKPPTGEFVTVNFEQI